ncbi:hypothetical protein [Enterococcus sp. AZ112]|uniref:hypothetical protein n=1 Tax=Enterococcus sp. AZ112 TaxID=2774812 RepID=UPI003F688B9E
MDNFVHNSVENHKKAFYLGLSTRISFRVAKKIDASSEGLLAKSKGAPKVERRFNVEQISIVEKFFGKNKKFHPQSFCREFKNACQAFFEKMWITF